MAVKYISIRTARFSFLLEKKGLFIGLGGVGLVGLALIWSTSIGTKQIPFFTTLQAILGQGTPMDIMVIQLLRLPRILLAILVGIALAVSGVILQTVSRSSLASPNLLGIVDGSAVGAVSFLVLFTDNDNILQTSIHWLPLFAFTGGMMSALFIYVLVVPKGVSPIRMILIGIGVGALMKAGTALMIIVGPIYRATDATVWLAGSVNYANWNEVAILFPITVFWVGWALFKHNTLNVLALSPHMAQGVGSGKQKDLLFFLILSVLLTSAAVSFAGGIGFVGLMAPHIARKLVGSKSGALLLTSAAIGALLVLLSDLIGRTLMAPFQLPAGIFTAILGVPFFIYLMLTSRS